MARGTAVGEPVVSQANTPEFTDGYARTFGDRGVLRGKWVFDKAQQKLVPADEYQPPARALDAPIMMDRFYEGTTYDLGGGQVADIGSRRKRKAFMKELGFVDHDDAKAEARIVQNDFQRQSDRERKESLGRAIHDVRERRRKRR
jgi:hypothetical protein